jgi:hypothetical protein
MVGKWLPAEGQQEGCQEVWKVRPVLMTKVSSMDTATRVNFTKEGLGVPVAECRPGGQGLGVGVRPVSQGGVHQGARPRRRSARSAKGQRSARARRSVRRPMRSASADRSGRYARGSMSGTRPLVRNKQMHMCYQCLFNCKWLTSMVGTWHVNKVPWDQDKKAALRRRRSARSAHTTEVRAAQCRRRSAQSAHATEVRLLLLDSSLLRVLLFGPGRSGSRHRRCPSCHCGC